MKSGLANRKNRKRLVLSQTMVMDVDPNKVCLISRRFFLLTYAKHHIEERSG